MPSGRRAIIAFSLLGVFAVVLVYLADPDGIGNTATVRALTAVTVLEFSAVLIMVKTSFIGVVGAVVLFGIVVWLLARTLRASRLWLGATRLRLAKANWQKAADAARVQRALAESASAATAPAADVEGMLRRRVAAERRLSDAEQQWADLVDELEPVAALAVPPA